MARPGCWVWGVVLLAPRLPAEHAEVHRERKEAVEGVASPYNTSPTGGQCRVRRARG